MRLFLPFCSSCSLRCWGGWRYLHGGSRRWHLPCIYTSHTHRHARWYHQQLIVFIIIMCCKLRVTGNRNERVLETLKQLGIVRNMHVSGSFTYLFLSRINMQMLNSFSQKKGRNKGVGKTEEKSRQNFEVKRAISTCCMRRQTWTQATPVYKHPLHVISYATDFKHV